MLRAPHDRGRIIALALATVDNGLLHPREGMFGEKLEHANIVTRPGTRAMLRFQGTPQFAKDRRQLPIAVDVRVIERRGLAGQRDQVVQRIEHLLIVTIRARVLGNDLAVRNDVQAPYIDLEGHTPKSVDPRHAVAIAVEAYRLVLVHAGWLFQAGVKRPRR